MNPYLVLKYAHVCIAIVALGTGAAVGMLLGFFADDAMHGEFVLRLSRRLLNLVVMPGYLLMLATGMWMGHLADLLDAHWTEAAMNLWGVGALFMALWSVFLRRQIRQREAREQASSDYRRARLMGTLSGSAAALVLLAILGFMVFKPG